MFIVFILAFARGWVVGNKAGKEDSKEFMPGDRVWFYDIERDKIDEGVLCNISQGNMDKKITWAIDVRSHRLILIKCKCHLFRSLSEADEFIHFKNGGK